MPPGSDIRQRRRHRPDYAFIIAMGILLLVGLVIIYSISPVLSHKILGDVGRNFFLYNQLSHLAVGLAGFFFASQWHYGRWQKLIPILVVLSGLMLLLLMIPGLSLTKNGATRWLDLGPLSFQPAELLKFTSIILMASWFGNLGAEQLRQRAKTLMPTLGLLGVLSIFVLFAQKDLGTMLVLAIIIVGMFFASGVSLRQLGVLLGRGSGVGVASIILFPHRLARITTFLNPNQGIDAQSYHLNQALIAIGSGGLWGLGVGKSVQVYGYLPEAANDSIFAIAGETFGLIGGIIILSLFGYLIYRGFRIALGAPTRYGQLLGLGIMLWVSSQMLINVTAMIGLIPLTGIPLPFLSYGGTSLVMLMVGMGIMVNISKYTERGSYANSAIRRRDGGAYNPNPSYRPGAAGSR